MSESWRRLYLTSTLALGNLLCVRKSKSSACRASGFGFRTTCLFKLSCRIYIYIYKLFSLYRTDKMMCYHYKYHRLVNTCNFFLSQELYGRHKCTVWAKCIFLMLHQVECIVTTKVWRVQVMANTIARFAVLMSAWAILLFIWMAMDDHWAERSFLMTQAVLASVICWRSGILRRWGRENVWILLPALHSFVWSCRATIYFVHCTRDGCCQFIFYS
jgi:hypothetical protein